MPTSVPSLVHLLPGTVFRSTVLILVASGLAASARAESPLLLRHTIQFEDPTHLPSVISAARFDPSGQWIAAAGDDHLVRVWATKTGKLVHRLRGHVECCRSAAFSQASEVLATSGHDGRLLQWDLKRGELLGSFPMQPQSVALHYNRDGTLLATAGRSDQVRVYDTATRRLAWEFDAPCADVGAAVFSPRDETLAVAGRNGRIRLVAAGGEQPRDIAAHRQRIRALAFSPEGDRLASAGDDRVIRIWNLAQDREVGALASDSCKVYALAFCGPRHLASGGTDNSIRIWDLSSGQEVARLAGHTGTVGALDYHHGNLVSGSFDTTLRLWTLPGSIIEPLRAQLMNPTEATR